MKKINFEKMTIRQKINFVNKNENLANIPFNVLIDVVDYDMNRIQRNMSDEKLERLLKISDDWEPIMYDLSTGCSKMGLYQASYRLDEYNQSVNETILVNNFPDTDDEFYDDNFEIINHILYNNVEAKELIIKKEMKEYINNHKEYIKMVGNADDVIKYSQTLQEIIQKYSCEKCMKIMTTEINKELGIED